MVSGKVLQLEDLANIISDLKSTGKKVAQCHGCFDILHPGHIRHLESAKKFADVLVVTVTPDRFVNKGPGRPWFPENLRAEVLASISCVDYVAINNHPTAVGAIELLKPDFYVKGKEYSNFAYDVTGGIVDESDAIKSVGGSLVFTNDIVFSSSNLINKQAYPEDTYAYLRKIANKYPLPVIYDTINKTSNLRVLVIGETIIDEYQYGESIGKSGKSPVVAFKLGNKETYEGGVLVIAKHMSSFVRQVDLIPSNVITKKRYVEGSQKVFETYDIDENHPDICEEVNSRIGDYDLVLVADFGHGLITTKLRNIIKQKAKFLAVATQRNAGNMGHNTIRKYWDRKDNIFICIDDDELRLAIHEKYDRNHDLKDIVNRELSNVSIVTRGPHGCIAGGEDIPALATYVVDTVGAGDALLSVTSPLVCVGVPMDLVGFIGCAAGAIACSYVCNKEHVDKKTLCRFIETVLK